MPISKKKTLFSRFSTALLTTSLLAMVACSNGGGGGEVALPDDPTSEGAAESPSGTVEKPITETPGSVTDSQREAILKNYDHVDPSHIVPYKSLEDALVYFHQNKSRFSNQNYLSIINFAQSSKEKRFYIIDMKTGSVWAMHVAHGKGSDSNHDGIAEKFSNVSGSNASSLGIYKAAESYNGSNGLSLRLDGLSSTNSNARSRAIVIHGANYVQESNVIQGRSWGCPAVAMENRDAVIKYLKGGSMVYAVVDNGGTEAPSVPSVPSDGTYAMHALSWETSSNPERKQWSQYLMKLLLNDWSSLLNGASDMKDFCPRYASLSNHDRANVWAQLFSAMTKFESNYNPLSRMHETTMGTDPITKKPVYSEGLLQLSYQDITGWNFCKFDWNKDKNLSATSPKKTILDPYINLHCGVGIMAKQVARKGVIKLSTGAYWAVIKTNSKYQKISQITSMVRALPLCK
ncbi:murein L,D-transpeptidase catalytic domain family protein [Bdellovibrio bacteriovorus]|uniref:murein L,D-transpeptidase catalytic domain family protein n=1 Tax=Bdellovibrio bacteriovorus TaxID=959 RepID=UPI0035A5F7E3